MKQFRNIFGVFLAIPISLAPCLAFSAERNYLRDNVDALNATQQALAMQTMSAAEVSVSLAQSLGLSANDGLQLISSRTDADTGLTHSRYRQTFRGVPVWSENVLVTSNQFGKTQMLHGNAVSGIDADVAQVAAGLSMKSVVANLKQAHIKQQAAAADASWQYENETSELVIYLDDSNKAHLAFAVSFFADVAEGGMPTRPTYIVDANSGKTLLHFEGLAHAKVGTGPGGNDKTQRYDYGIDFDKLDVSVSGSTYTMSNANVKTVDLNHGTSGSSAYSYQGPQNTRKRINGAFSPLNDAHYFGGVIFDMFQQWYNTAPLTFQLAMRVHYSNSYENAFWNGSSMTFGDGRTTFYPLVSLDVSAHEVSHGFTEQNSGLVYSNQSGGMNEAFSDVAGEAAEYFSRGSNDWKTGAEIFKGNGALRYLDNPPADGRSIGSANDYTNGMDVHYSSGVFNKAFYTLATRPGWNTQKAFDTYVKANQNYWSANSTFQQGAQGVKDAAASLSYNTADVVAAFAAVDIALSGGPGPGPTPSFCAASGNNQSYEWIAGVSAGNLNNTSGASGYSDFTSQSMNASRGQSYTVSLTPGFGSSAYTENWRVWIDYNQNNTFDANEKVYEGRGSAAVSGNFTVPASAKTGATRMRVVMQYNSYRDACGTFTYGEVEDYGVNVQ